MDNAAKQPAAPMTADHLQQLTELYEKGLYLQAYRAGEHCGPPSDWQGIRARLFAGRLVIHLGAATLSNWLIRRAYRDAPSDFEARYFYGYCLWRWRGPYFTWRWLKQHAEVPPGISADLHSSWYALFAGVAGALRDFETAEQWMTRADATLSASPWVEVCRAQLFEMEDRYEDAYQAVCRALELRPGYRPAVQSASHILTLLDRDDEAVKLLAEAAEQMESSAVSGQLCQLQIELKQYEAARESLRRCAEFSPLADKNTKKWLAAQRSDLAYRLGDYDAAIKHAEASDNEFFKTIAKHLQQPERADAKVVTLSVGFVRQHHLTCGPATLSAISRFWSMPADHVQVAEEICYNGTSAYSERKWAEEHGWLAREFTVTEPAAALLIDRGVPFTLATVEPANAHLQAVIGYDGRRGTLIIRDPYWRSSSEALVDKLLERYRAYGPRGMAIVPVAQPDKFDGVDLPETDLWDQLHRFDGALVNHCRSEAKVIYEQLSESVPDHRVTREARRRLAIYDQNPTEHLAAVTGLLEINPEDQSLQLERLSCLRDLARREERLATYREMCGKKETHPVFWQQYAQELRVDARRHEDAIWLLRRAIRRWPTEGGNYYVLANIYWDQRRFEEALELYRFAACLDDKEERFAHVYFNSSLSCMQTQQALDFLRDRFERAGAKSSLPARTLFSACQQLERSEEGLKIVDEALERCPDDGELVLFAADAYLACSTENLPRAEEFLAQAKQNSPPGAWLRTAARMAACDGRLSDSLDYWQQVLETQPLAIDAHRAVTQLLAETKGQEAALAHLENVAARFPHHHPLHELWIEWLRDEPIEVAEPVMRRVIAANPDDAWVRRELVLWLADARRFEEAWQQMDVAGQLDPLHPSYHMVRGHLLEKEGRIEETRQALRQAIELSVDNNLAISELIGLCDTIEQRREVLAFVKDQLVDQVIFGDGLLAFRTHAHEALEADETLALLQEAWEARPDLWHAWAAMIGQLLDMNRLEQAQELAEQAMQRFPLLPRLWLDRARVSRALGDNEAELEALQTAYRINPDWGTAVRMLCDLHERRGDYERARTLLEQAVARNPLDVVTRIQLAEAMWREDQREQALQEVQRAVQLEPGYEQAWAYLNRWSDQLGCPERALQAARELTERRGGETRSWLTLARMLDDLDQLDERLEAIDKAIQLNPRCIDAYDLRALSLAAAERWEEALEACQPQVWGEQPPGLLSGRAAWIEAERGNLEEAIARMQRVVQQEPYLYEAWSQLADWQAQADDADGYLEAAEALVSIAPQNEVSFGYLGEARLMKEDREGAREAFQHAVELNPMYEFGGNALFDLQIEDGDLPGAAGTMEMLKTHAESPFISAREVRLATRQKDRDRAVDSLKCLAEMPSDNPTPLVIAVRDMVETGWQRPAENVLEELLHKEGVDGEVLVQWAKLRGARRDRQCAATFRDMMAQGRDVADALQSYIDALVDKGALAMTRQFVLNNEPWLRQSTRTWGVGGYTLTRLREFKRAAQWQADWRERDDAEAWMLVNVVEGLRFEGREAEAADASRRALALPPQHGQHLHHLWLAADDALRDDFQAAQEHLAHAREGQLDSDYDFLATLVEGVVEVATAPARDKPSALAKVKRKIDRAKYHYKAYAQEPVRRRVYRRCLAAIARHVGGLQARLWFWARWLRSW